MTTNIKMPRVTRVDTLTGEQRARMPEWVERWVRIGLATTEGETGEERDARRARAEAAVGAHYHASNLDPPMRKVWVTSPLAGVFAFSGAALILAARNRASVGAVAVRDSVSAAVRGSVRASVDAAVHASVDASVDAAVRDSVDAAVRDSVYASVYASVDASVDAAVRDSVNAAVRASVRASVHDSVRASIGDSVYTSVYTSVDNSVDASVNAAVRDSVNDSVSAAVRASVGDSVRDSVRASVHASVRASVHASVDASVDAAVRDSVNAAVRDSVHASVYASVDAAVRDSVYASVRASVHDSVDADPDVLAAYRETLGSTWWRYLGGQFWVGYGWGWWTSPSMLSYLRDVCGLDLGDRQPITNAVITLGESSCWVWPHRDFVMLCERPKIVARDDRGRLHREDGPAAEWGDGWGVYAWHGVRVPADIILHPENITAERIAAEQNAEVRRVLLERFALLHADDFAEALGAKVLDADLDQYERPRRLLSIAPRPGTDDEPIVMVELRNATLEPDGSRKTYVLRCDPQLRPLRARGERGRVQKMTCQNAVASLVGLTGAEYAPEVET